MFSSYQERKQNYESIYIYIYLFRHQDVENILKDNIFFLIKIFEIEKYIKDIFRDSEK